MPIKGGHKNKGFTRWKLVFFPRLKDKDRDALQYKGYEMRNIEFERMQKMNDNYSMLKKNESSKCLRDKNGQKYYKKNEAK